MSNVKYIKSAVNPADFPKTKFKEIAFAGRSNAGKSSLINAISNAKIANVSGTPGKTKLLSFFNYNNQYVLVDMPGYGFAARSNDEIGQWKDMIDNYFQFSEKFAGLILVMDIRRDWIEDEELIKKFSNYYNFPMIIALTKADKLSRNEQTKRIAMIKKQSRLEAVFLCSSLKKTGVEELQNYIYKNLIDPKLDKLDQ